jgi:hypothetical protein
MTEPTVAQFNNSDDEEIDDETDSDPSAAEIFAAQLCCITEILGDMRPWDQGAAIALLAAEHIGTMVKSDFRRVIRDQMVKLIDEGILDVLERIEANQFSPSVELQLALMPTAPTRAN